MASDKLKTRFAEIEKLSLAAGLKPFDVHFFEVPPKIIWEVASYGLPIRYSHWSFGRSYEQQKTRGEMGLAKIYELVLNSDPCVAFLDSHNDDVTNLLVAAHVTAHSDFFANNMLFEGTSRNMVEVAKNNAAVIDRYRNEFGDDEIDAWLDLAIAMERHIDCHKGIYRQRYPKRETVYKEHERLPYADIVGSQKRLVTKQVRGQYLPPYLEKDLLWFFSNYANLDDWQKHIFEIVRKESFYFYPQYRTRILNEGWSVYFHAELMYQYSMGKHNDYGVDLEYPLTEEEHLEFAAQHEKVVQPGPKIPLKVKVPVFDKQGRYTGKKKQVWNPIFQEQPELLNAAIRLNPYYVGYRILKDIEKRWDEYYEQGHMEGKWGEKIPVTINGRQKLFDVRREEDDVSLFRNYLTDELIADMGLFSFGNDPNYKDDYEIQDELSSDSAPKDLRGVMAQDQTNKTIRVSTKKLRDIVAHLEDVRTNYGVPCIAIRRVDPDGTLRLEHDCRDHVNLDLRYAKVVLQYIYRIWHRPVEIVRRYPGRTDIVAFSGHEFSVDSEQPDYPASVEKKSPASSW